MELQTTMRRIGSMQTIFDDFDERPVDCDFMLPDFLPDIAAILKCTIKPIVQSHQVSGDRVMADGTVYLHLLYLDEDRKCVRSFENSQPFTSVFTVKELSSSDMVYLTAKPNYVNCRATGPRRVDIHGAFSVKLKVVGRADADIVEAVSADNLYSKGCPVTYSVAGDSALKLFTLNEVLEIESEAPMETIIRTEAHICISNCKQMAGKAIVKGEVLLKTVYMTDMTSGVLHKAKHCIPFSQILDVDSLTEDMLCEVQADILSCDVKATPNPNGENRLLSVSVKSALSLQCFVNESCELLTDAFHTTYPLTLTKQRITPCCITHLSCESVTVQSSLSLPNGDIATVLDVWGEVGAVSCTDDGLQGQLLVQLLACDANGMISYYERPLDIVIPVNGVCAQTEATVSVLDCDYTLTGERLELSLKVFVCRRTSVAESQLLITDMQMNEDTPYSCTEGMENCQVKVCFGNAGDSLWEIAKAEHASPTALMKENELSDDILHDHTMLLIPLS